MSDTSEKGLGVSALVSPSLHYIEDGRVVLKIVAAALHSLSGNGSFDEAHLFLLLLLQLSDKPESVGML